jgi:dipeptidyl aminopeptidase/acylaminoacyl peptidase
MRPEDLASYSTVSDPNLHPEAVRVVFVVTTMDLDADRYVRRLWLWDGEQARPFTSGPGDTRPRWSPDGERLLFLRAGGEKKAPSQVAVMPAAGGEAEVITSFELGATEAEWSPDGTRIAVVGVTWTDEWAGIDDEERGRRARRIVRAGYRHDNLGWRHDRRSNVYVIDGDSAAVPLTEGEFHDSAVVWHPDGAAVAFLSARHEQRGIQPGSRVWEVPVAGGEPRPLVDVGLWYHVSYRPDGECFAIGVPDAADYPGVLGLHRLVAGDAVPFAGHLDRSVFSQAPPVAPAGPQWLDDGSCLIVLEDAGRLRVIRVAPDQSSTDVLAGDRLITGVSPTRDGSAFTFAASSPTGPGLLGWFDGSAERHLSEFDGPAGVIEPESFTVERDGVTIDAWAYLPEGDDRVPLLLSIHGGPATQYGYGFFDEFQVYAGAGYGVVACNPRGSSGRGAAFVRAPVDAWEQERPVDLEDILAVVEAALERFPRLDSARMGIMGGSYGGFMTAKILTVDDRWRSAVPERGLYSFASFAGTSDIGHWFPGMYLTGWDYEDGWGRLWRAGPLARAHRITTPCLVVHSEHDWRCPIEQAEQFSAVLLASGVETELLRFPGEGHELSRSGSPKHRRERFEAILDWHARHLGDVTT